MFTIFIPNIHFVRPLLLFLLFALTIASRPAARGQKFEIVSAGNQGETPSGRLIQTSDGAFYGTTNEGGAFGYGTAFKISPAGVHTVLVAFNESTGKNPDAGLVLGSDGNFYGTTIRGGENGNGTVFKVTPAGVLTTLVWFNNQNGSSPSGELIEGSDGCFYGTTSQGGANSRGTVFKVTSDGELTTLANFDGINGSSPAFSLIEGSDGNFYGVTSGGGTDSRGTVFKVTPAGVLTSLVSFNGSNGSLPTGGLIEGGDGSFYGVTRFGGTANLGTVYKITSTGELTTLASFAGGDSRLYRPSGTLAKGSDGNFYGVTSDGGSNFRGAVFKVTPAGVLTTFASFDDSDGSGPISGLLLAQDGNFHGTTLHGGPQERGTVFKMTPQGGITTLSSFATPKGNFPSALLTKGGDGNSYGLTPRGGKFEEGSIFKVTPDGVMTVVVSFSGYRGSYPYGALVAGSDGSLYGTTSQGGTDGKGTVFKVTPFGNLTTLVSFNGDNGWAPVTGLTAGRDGNFYGTTSGGGANNRGTLFKITPAGELTTLVSFSGADGLPRVELLEGRDGNFYGTTTEGGVYGYGNVFKMTSSGELTMLAPLYGISSGRLLQGTNGNFYGTMIGGIAGAIFKMTPQGELTILVSDPGTTSGILDGGLVEGTDGNLYGTTSWASRYDVGLNNGTIFRVTPDGTLTTLYSFDGVTARSVDGTPVFGSDGKLYGAGAEMVIWQLSIPPSVTADLPKVLTSRSATISGLVNANNEATTVNFEYGLTPSYGSSVAVTPGTVTGRSTTAVSATLSGLNPNTTYFYRFTASNINGTTSTTDASFTTAPMGTGDVFARSSVITTLPVLQNDNDGEQAGLTITAVTQGSLGTVTINGSTLTYIPGPLFRGHDSFSYTVSDGINSSTAQVELWGPYTQALLSKDSAVPGAGQEGSEIAEGAVFKSFGELSLNSAGKFAFTASYGVPGDSAELSVFGIEPNEGNSPLVARRGQVAPGTDEALFTAFKDPLLNEAGEIAFLATLSGGDTTKKNREGIWISSVPAAGGPGAELVARTGTQPPGAPTGAQWKSFTSVALTSTADASANTDAPPQGGSWLLAFTGFMTTGPGGVNAGSDMGLWLASPEGTILALREGQKLQIEGTEKQLRTFAALKSLPYAAGQGNGITSMGGVAVQAFFKDGTQALLQVSLAREDGTGLPVGSAVIEALGLPGDAISNLSETASKFGIPSQSSSGAVTAWLGSLTGKIRSTALFERNRSEPEFLQLLARIGDTPAGIEKGTFAAFRNVAVNDAGSALFLGRIAGRGISKANDEGLWWKPAGDDSSAFQLLARKGAQPPGVPQGARWSIFSSIALPEGEMGPLFTASLVAGSGKKSGPGGIRSSNDQGLWAVDSKGTLQLVAQEGQEVIINGSDTTRRLTSFTVLRAVPGSLAQRRSFGSGGQIVYRALLNDGSQAVVKVLVP